MPTCKTCGCEKDSSAFYASNRSHCKECVKARVRDHREANIDKVRAYDRQRGGLPHRVEARKAYQETEAFRQSHAKANEKYRVSRPERMRAHTAVNNAIRDGRLIPWPVCAIPECTCAPEAHHPDYSRPLDVVWLCDGHHKEAHKLARELEREAA